MIEQITDYKNSKKEEDVPCVLLVGPKPYVDKLLTRLMDYDA
jgi:hypothetical protein